jgi:hypothetical protein
MQQRSLHLIEFQMAGGSWDAALTVSPESIRALMVCRGCYRHVIRERFDPKERELDTLSLDFISR